MEIAPYGVFSTAHLREKFNFLLLISPVAIVALPGLVFGWRSVVKWLGGLFYFIGWTATGCILFSFFMNPLLGIRDWDLLSPFGVPVALLSGITLISAYRDGWASKGLLIGVVLFSMVHTFNWIYVNSDVESGIGYLDRVRNEDLHTATGKNNLGFLLQEKGYLRHALRQYSLVTGKRHITATYNIAYCYLALQLPDSAIINYNKLAGTHWNKEKATEIYTGMSLAFDMKEEPDSATTVFLEMKKKGLILTEDQTDHWSRAIGLSGVFNFYNT